MRSLSVLSALGAALALAACTYVERERQPAAVVQPAPTVVQPAPTVVPAPSGSVTVRPGY